MRARPTVLLLAILVASVLAGALPAGAQTGGTAGTASEPPQHLAATFTGRGLANVTATVAGDDVVLFTRIETGLLSEPTRSGRTRTAEAASDLTVEVVDVESRAVVLSAFHEAAATLRLSRHAVVLDATEGRIAYEVAGVQGRILAFAGATLRLEDDLVHATFPATARVVAVASDDPGFLAALDAGAFALDLHANPGLVRDDVVRGNVRMLKRDEVREGHAVAWEATLEGDGPHLVRVTVPSAFFLDVDRARQLVPHVNARIPHEADAAAIADLLQTRSGTAYNRSVHESTGEHVLLFRVGGPGPHEIRVVRDVAAPRLDEFHPGIPAATGFLVELATDEPSHVELRIRARGDGGDDAREGEGSEERITSATASRHFLRVQGLDPETTYAYTLALTDHAGNVRDLGPYLLTTPPGPDPRRPVLVDIHPLDKAVLADSPGRIRATWTLPEGIHVDPATGVRLLLDGRVVPKDRYDATNTTIEHAPGNLGPGDHRVRLEVTTTGGAKATAEWTFTIQGPFRIPGTPAVGLLLVVVVIALAGRGAISKP